MERYHSASFSLMWFCNDPCSITSVTLNSLRSRELNAALESVYRYYEKQQWAGGGANAGSRAATKGEETDEEKCRRFRYAALNLATLHCQFGHK